MAFALGKSCIDHTHEKFVAKQWMSQGEVQLSKYYALSLIKGFFDFQKVSQLLHFLVPFVLEPFPLRRRSPNNALTTNCRYNLAALAQEYPQYGKL